MDTALSKEVRFLKLYSVFATAVFSVFLISAVLPSDGREAFEEIDVERINIVEADGQLRMVISNQARQHPGIINGKIIERSAPRPPGMIFFNHLGDEMGGLVFGENGETGHFGSLTFDKVRNDQTIGFRHLEGDDGRYSSALEMWQYSDEGTGSRRLTLGKGRDDVSQLSLHDIQGRVRIRMHVAPDGTARLDFFDETGSEVLSLP